MNILLTGTPGSGKTALVGYANGLGDVRFVDSDKIAGLCEWREFKTGKVLGDVSDYKEAEKLGGNTWYAKYGWYWRVNFLKQFLKNNPNSIICGSSENIADCYKLFGRIFILKKTEAELLSNLQNPTRDNPFGKTLEQRKGFMKWQNYLIREAKKYDPAIIRGNSISNSYNLLISDIGVI